MEFDGLVKLGVFDLGPESKAEGMNIDIDPRGWWVSTLNEFGADGELTKHERVHIKDTLESCKVFITMRRSQLLQGEVLFRSCAGGCFSICVQKGIVTLSKLSVEQTARRTAHSNTQMDINSFMRLARNCTVFVESVRGSRSWTDFSAKQGNKRSL
jgi:hypothetical protein